MYLSLFVIIKIKMCVRYTVCSEHTAAAWSSCDWLQGWSIHI